MLVVNEQIAIPLKEIELSFSRSPGPGGQNVNKLNTKVTLKWQLVKSQSLPLGVKQRAMEAYTRRINKQGELIVISHRFRDQGRNVADCLNRLRAMMLAVAEEPTPRKKTRPSRTSKLQRLDNKRRQSEKKRRRRVIGHGE